MLVMVEMIVGVFMMAVNEAGEEYDMYLCLCKR